MLCAGSQCAIRDIYRVAAGHRAAVGQARAFGVASRLSLALVWRLRQCRGSPRLVLPQALATTLPQHLRLRVAADGEADRLSRIRRALADRERDQSDGRAGARPRAGAPLGRARRSARRRRRARLPLLFRFDQARADRGADGGRRESARHRPRDHADGLFRPVRARRAGGGDGHCLAQRQRLDRGEDGRGAPGDFRAGGNGAAARHRHRRRSFARARRLLRVRARLSGPLPRRPDEPAEIQAPDEGRRRVRQRHGGRLRAAITRARSASKSCRSTAISTGPFRATIRTPRICICCTRWRRR